MAPPVSEDAPSQPVPVPISLQSALHAATRSLHTNLNKNITARLPLCLPPNTSDPTAYYLGMLTIGQIYLTFERAIQDVVSETATQNETRSRHIQILQTLYTEHLPRTHLLRQDFETLSRRLRLQHPEIALVEARVQAQAEKCTQHVYENIQSKPYLALAYTWTMYLALFNGGRWLQKQLASAGSDFWLEDTQITNNAEIGTQQNIHALSFWRFDTSSNDPEAEGLKLEFKKNFEEASQMLTSEEKDEVVLEASSLFELCLRLIENLDLIMAEMNRNTQQSSEHPTHEASTGIMSAVANTIWHTLSSNLLSPASSILYSRWTRPITQEVKAVD